MILMRWEITGDQSGGAKPHPQKAPTAESLDVIEPLNQTPRVAEVPFVIGITRRSQALTY